MTREELERLAQQVSDGQDIDWDEIAASSPDERALLEELRTLAAVARLHRTQAMEGDHAEGEHEHAEGSRPPAPPIGRWAHLDLLERLGGGAYGEVFRAWDPRLERQVALKLLHLSPRRRRAASVVREAQLLARVQHPNVLTVHGAEVFEGRVGLWTELITGQTLDSLVRQLGPMNAGEAALVGATLCRALAAVHAAGLLHRDIKAQNVMRAAGGRIVLMDFGAGSELSQPGPFESMTGTPAYIAPEVLRGEPASVRSDVYSLGVLLYFLVTGRFPVDGATLAAVRESHDGGARMPLRAVRTDLPKAFVQVVERACAPDPAARFASALELEQALGHTDGLVVGLSSGRTRPRWIGWPLVAAGMAVVLAAVAAAILWTYRSESPAPVFTRLTFRQGRVHAARFGLDADTILYSAAWGREQPRVFLTTVGARESRPLGPPDANLLAFSRSGEMAIAMTPRFLRGYVEAGTLARAPLTGGRARELLEGVQAADWSPDGTALAIVRDVGERARLEYPIGQVLYESAGWIGSPRVAPDGSAVAFFDHPTDNDDGGRVAVVSRDGEVERLTPAWVSAQGLAWSPDGQEVWFTASEFGNLRALYAVDLDKNVRLLHRAPTRLRLHDIAPDGSALLTTSTERVELLAGRADGAQERDLSWLDWSIVRDISTDGRTLLLNESGEGGGEQYAVYLREVAGGDALRLGAGSGLALSPDGRQVLAISRGGEPKLQVLPTGAGTARPLPSAGLQFEQWGGWFPDGHRVVFAARGEGEGTRLFTQSVDGHAPPRPISPEGVRLGSSAAVSPDGSRIAVVGASGRPMVLDVGGAPVLELPAGEVGEVPVQWTPDGRALFVARRGMPPVRIHLVDLQSAQRRLWRVLSPVEPSGAQEILRVVVSRDASTYAYSLVRELSDLYVTKGFTR